jgi:hypothetical protein
MYIHGRNKYLVEKEQERLNVRFLRMCGEKVFVYSVTL